MFALSRLCAFILFVSALPVIGSTDDAFDAQSAARDILNDSLAAEKREQMVEASVPHAAAVIRAMTTDMPDDQAEEYRRIPWIWRVAIATGKKNDEKQLRELLDASLPAKEEPLRDWQAVVIGGGIINGISQTGQSPAERFKELMSPDDFGHRCLPRWRRTIELAAKMVDDAETPTGTRYDALRILGATTWKEYGSLISKYLAPDTNEELQMGAVSAAGDLDDDDAGRCLLEKLDELTEANRDLAIDALFFRHRKVLEGALLRR